MKIRLFVVLPIFSMFVFSCKTTETNTDTITGMIYDNEGECVSGVKIFVEGKLIAQSDLYGHFYVPVNELSENHQVEFSKEEYEAITMKIDPFSSVKMLYVVMRNYRQILNEIEQSISDGEFGKGLELCHKAKNIKNSVYIDYLESTILICSRNYYPAIRSPLWICAVFPQINRSFWSSAEVSAPLSSTTPSAWLFRNFWRPSRSFICAAKTNWILP